MSASRRPYEQSDVFRSRNIADGRLSPDGTYAIYQLSETVPGKTKDEDGPRSGLWRIDLASGETRRLTSRAKNAMLPAFAPNAAALYYLSSEGEKPAQIYRLPLDGGEGEEVTSLEQGVNSFALSPDGNWIAFSALGKVPKERGPNEHVRITRYPYRIDGANYLDDAAEGIYVIPASGGEQRELRKPDGTVRTLTWSPDSKEIATVVASKAKQKVFVWCGELSVLDLNGSERVLTEGNVGGGQLWTEDGSKIVYVSPPPGDYSGQPQLYVVDRSGGKPVLRTEQLDLAVGGLTVGTGWASSHLLLTPDGKSVITPVTRGGETALYRIAISGLESCEPITSGNRTVHVLDRVGNTLLCTSQDATTPIEFHLIDLATGSERTLTRNNQELCEQIAWPELERVTVTSAPGVEIEGWILKPAFGKPPYKTILNIHGGPHAGFGIGFSDEFHELTGAGYAVAFCNPRGSTGYGDAFARSIIERTGPIETEDFNAFLDELIKRGITDPDKLGVMGGSYGGQLSGWIIGRTDRFKAAVPMLGVYNQFSVYGTADGGIDGVTAEMNGPPHELAQRYWELSPIAYAHKVKTPTLLIQGEKDLRCPMEQAEQFFSVLKYNGCEVEFIRMQNCNHGGAVWSAPVNRRFRMDAIKDWFDRHIT